MKEIGDILERKRLENKFSREYVNAQTHIPLQYLAAMEDGDLSVFPAEVYYLGFLRRYSKFLGLNDEDLISIYRRKVTESTLTHNAAAKDTSFGLSSSFYTVLICAVAALFIVLFLWMKHDMFVSPLKTAAGPLVSSGVKSEEPVAKEPVREAAISGLTLNVSCSEPAWIKIVGDEKLVFEGVLRQGDQKEWKSKEKFYISIGYVPGIAVSLNGKQIDIKKGSKQDVNSLTLTKSDLEENQNP